MPTNQVNITLLVLHLFCVTAKGAEARVEALCNDYVRLEEDPAFVEDENDAAARAFGVIGDSDDELIEEANKAIGKGRKRKADDDAEDPEDQLKAKVRKPSGPRGGRGAARAGRSGGRGAGRGRGRGRGRAPKVNR